MHFHPKFLQKSFPYFFKCTCSIIYGVDAPACSRLRLSAESGFNAAIYCQLQRYILHW